MIRDQRREEVSALVILDLVDQLQLLGCLRSVLKHLLQLDVVLTNVIEHLILQKIFVVDDDVEGIVESD